MTSGPAPLGRAVATLLTTAVASFAGCYAGLEVTGAGGVTVDRAPVGEGAARLFVGMGSAESGVAVTLAGGGGATPDDGRSYGMFRMGPRLSVFPNQALELDAELIVRAANRGPDDVWVGAGATVRGLFPLSEDDGPRVSLGPFFGVEYVGDEGRDDNALFLFGLALRYTAVDTTGHSGRFF